MLALGSNPVRSGCEPRPHCSSLTSHSSIIRASAGNKPVQLARRAFSPITALPFALIDTGNHQAALKDFLQ